MKKSNNIARKEKVLRGLLDRQEGLKEKIERTQKEMDELRGREYQKWAEEVLSILKKKKLHPDLLQVPPEEVATYLEMEYGARWTAENDKQASEKAEKESAAQD